MQNPTIKSHSSTLADAISRVTRDSLFTEVEGSSKDTPLNKWRKAEASNAAGLSKLVAGAAEECSYYMSNRNTRTKVTWSRAGSGYLRTEQIVK